MPYLLQAQRASLWPLPFTVFTLALTDRLDVRGDINDNSRGVYVFVLVQETSPLRVL